MDSADKAAEAGEPAYNRHSRPAECFHRILSRVPGLKTRSLSSQQTAVKSLPSLLHARVGFLTASSAPAHWKVLTSASPLHLQPLSAAAAILNTPAGGVGAARERVSALLLRKRNIKHNNLPLPDTFPLLFLQSTASA